MSVSAFQISEFPDDERYWRIDGIGALHYPGLSRSEPSVTVHLSELQSDFTHALSNTFVTGNSYFAHIKVGQIALLKPGYVWQNRSRLPHRILPKQIDVTLHGNALSLVRLDSPLETESEIVRILNKFQVSARSWGGLKDSWVAFGLNPCRGIEFLAIPCSVIFQKCLATSPNAIRRIVWGDLNNIVDRPTWVEDDPDGGVYYVEVAKNISSAEAYAHANLHADPIGREEYQRMRNELVVGSLNENRGNAQHRPAKYIRFGFPFSNLIELSIAGKYLPLNPGPNGEKRWGFLGTEIVSLTTKLVFDTLIAHRKNDGNQGLNSDEPGLADSAWPDRPRRELDIPSVPLHSNQDPSSMLDDICIEESGGFVAHGLSVIKDPKITQRYRKKFLKGKKGEFDGSATTGNPTGQAAGSAGADITAEEVPTPPGTLIFFLESLALLRDKGHTIETVATCSVTRKVDPDDVINFLPRNINGVRSWHRVSDSFEASPRGYIVARCYTGGTWHHFIELERKGSEAHALAHITAYDGRAIDPRQFGIFMVEVARCNGWSAFESRPHWILERMRHTLKLGSARFAESILKATG